MACQPASGGGGGTEGTGSSGSTSTGDGTTVGPADTTVGTEGGSSSGSSTTATPTTSGSTSTGEPCIPGEEGCECGDKDACDEGLACENDICVVPLCGNGDLDPGEDCDDSNMIDSDGCDADCTVSLGAAQVVAGDEHVCALFHTGAIKCWGNHEVGRLGYSGLGQDLGDDEVPADFGFVDVGEDVVELSLGSNFTCALLATDDVVCWGEGQHGRTGQGSQTDLGLAEDPSAIPPISLSGVPIQISAGAEHACATFLDGTLSCWGRNDRGQVGLPGFAAVGDDELPSDAPPVDVGANVLLVAAGGDHTCAVLGGGDVRCWGRNNVGQLGVPGAPDIGDNEAPSTNALVMLDSEVIDIGAGFNHTCVTFVTGEMQCWGEGGSGRLGLGNTDTIGDDEEVNTTIPHSLGSEPTHLGLGEEHTCVRLASTEIFCWGEGDNGRLGLGSTTDQVMPPPAQIDVALPLGPGAVTSGAAFACARTEGSDLKCWGSNNRGQLGQGLGFPTDLGDNELLDAVGAIPLE